MPYSHDDFVRTWTELATSRRVLAKAGALLGALSVFDFTTGDAQTSDTGGDSTRAVEWYETSDPDAVTAADVDGFITIYADFSFTAVGASWSGDVGVWPLVEIQVSYDGGDFSDIVTLPADVDTNGIERNGRTFSRLLFTNDESVIRYRTTDQNGVPVSVAEFGLTYIDASAGPSLSDAQSVTAADLTTPPAIISRASWGADESLRFSDGTEIFPRQYATVQHALVHHSETPNASDPLQQMRGIYYFHAITRGWGDIGYNYLVDKYGNVYEGRVGGQNVIGNHSLAYNVGAAGVCLIGNHQVAPPTAAEVSGLVGVLAWVCRDLDPLGFSDSWDLYNLTTISSHRDVTGVLCPGDYAYDKLPAIRTAVADTIANSPESPDGGFVVGDLVAIATGDGVPVNLRESPGTSSPVVTQLSDGVLGSVTGNPTFADGTNWYPISTAAGNGWTLPDYLEFQPPPLVGGALFAAWDVVAANRSTVVLLEVPVSSSTVMFTISRGTQMRVHAGPRFRSGKIWYHLYHLDFEDGAWGAEDDFVLSSQPSEPTLPVIGDLVATTDPVNFRTLPTLSASIIRTLPRSTEGTVIDGPRAANAYNWFQLQTAYGAGWTVTDFLRVTGTANPVPSPSPTVPPGAFQTGDTVVTTSALNLRVQPATSAAVLAVMSMGTIGTVLSGPVNAGGYQWYQLTASDSTGWAAGKYLNSSSAHVPTPTPPPGNGFPINSSVKTTTRLNVHSAATTGGSIIAVLPSGTVATVLDGPQHSDGYDWYQVQSSFGAGWVAGKYLVLTDAPVGIQVGSSVRTTAGLRLRSAASTNGSILTTMPFGATSTVTGGPTNANGYTWWQLQTSDTIGWAAGAYLALA